MDAGGFPVGAGGLPVGVGGPPMDFRWIFVGCSMNVPIDFSIGFRWMFDDSR